MATSDYFFRINGWPVTIAMATSQQRVIKAGAQRRSFRGQKRTSEKNSALALTLTSTVKDVDEADALINLLTLGGHYFSFANGLEASTSLQPQAGFPPTGVRLIPNAWGDFGRGVLAVSASVSGVFFSVDAQIGKEWTVLMRRVKSSGGDFEGVAVRSSGSSYVGGSQSSTFGLRTANGGESLMVRVNDGVVDLVKQSTSHAEVISDLVILPWRACDSQLAAWTSASSGIVKWAPLPLLRLDGSAFGPTETITAKATLRSANATIKAHRTTGVGLDGGARTVVFDIEETIQRYSENISDPIATPTLPASALSWYDAGNVDGFRNVSVAHGDEVTSWFDRGSQGLAATPNISGVATLRQILSYSDGNASPGVLFANTGRLTTSTGSSVAGTARSALVVWRATSAATTKLAIDQKFGATGYRIGLSSPKVTAGFGASLQTTTSNHVSGSVGFVASKIVGGVLSISNNGTVETFSVTQPGTGSVGYDIGKGGSAPSSDFDGEILEIVVINSDVNLDDLEAYFRAKYVNADVGL